MRDLKHLYYFENLLTEANNDLVREAQANGDKAIGVTCFQIPEAVYSVPGVFPVYLRAPRSGSMEMGTYYMTSMNCEYCRALLERGLEGGYQFLDGIVGTAACSQMADCMENLETLAANEKEGYFVQHVDTPMKADENGINHLTRMCRKRILDKLTEQYGIDTSDEALRKAVAIHNEICDVITEIGEYRKEENPRITGYEFAVLTLATFACPKNLILDKLKETAEELKTRIPDEDYGKKYRARVVLVGSEIDDPDYIKAIEDAGALVVADRYCYGSLPDRERIDLNDEEDVLKQICRHNVKKCQCPRYMDSAKIEERKVYIDKVAKEYHADGVIVEQMKFCNFWGYERMADTHILRDDYGWPVLSIDRPYSMSGAGQLRTRVQAFVESIEIKKIQGVNAQSAAQK